MKESTGKPILDALINASESFATPTPERAAQPQSRGEHTAGPWTANDDGQIQCPNLNRYGNWIIATIGREMTYEDHANARLLAAAPELLQALKDVDKAYQEMFDVMPVAFQTYAHIVEAAIRKAEQP